MLNGEALNDKDYLRDLDLANKSLEAIYLQDSMQVSSSPRAAMVKADGKKLLDALQKQLKLIPRDDTPSKLCADTNSTIESQGSAEDESDEENRRTTEQGGSNADTPRPSLAPLETCTDEETYIINPYPAVSNMKLVSNFALGVVMSLLGGLLAFIAYARWGDMRNLRAGILIGLMLKLVMWVVTISSNEFESVSLFLLLIL